MIFRCKLNTTCFLWKCKSNAMLSSWNWHQSSSDRKMQSKAWKFLLLILYFQGTVSKIGLSWLSHFSIVNNILCISFVRSETPIFTLVHTVLFSVARKCSGAFPSHWNSLWDLRLFQILHVEHMNWHIVRKYSLWIA